MHLHCRYNCHVIGPSQGGSLRWNDSLQQDGSSTKLSSKCATTKNDERSVNVIQSCTLISLCLAFDTLILLMLPVAPNVKFFSSIDSGIEQCVCLNY